MGKWNYLNIVIVLLSILGQSLYHYIRQYRQLKAHSHGHAGALTMFDLRDLAVMIEMYKLSTQLLPSEKNIWNELSSALYDVATKDGFPLANWNRRHSNAKFEDGIIKDLWGNPMIYRTNDNLQIYKLYSIADNGIDEGGKGDDIKLQNWELEPLMSEAKYLVNNRGLRGLTRSDIGDLTVMIEMYKLATHSIPSEKSIWNELSSAPSNVTTLSGCPLVKWKSSYSEAKFEDGIVKDPWGNPIIYRTNDNKQIYELYSIGPNGIDEAGMGDDIKLDDYGLKYYTSVAKSLWKSQ